MLSFKTRGILSLLDRSLRLYFKGSILYSLIVCINTLEFAKMESGGHQRFKQTKYTNMLVLVEAKNAKKK